VYPLFVASASPDVPQLERWLDDLARRWERYFARDPKVPRPPERERGALERRLRDVSREELRSTVEQFRLEQLLHRFATYTALWQRQLREQEEARTASRVRPTVNETPAAAVSPEGDGYRTLHERYVGALRAAGSNASVNAERFRQALEQQRQALEARGAVVEGFEVVTEGSQVKLRARVRRGGGG
jgi:hypothetical protein